LLEISSLVSGGIFIGRMGRCGWPWFEQGDGGGTKLDEGRNSLAGKKVLSR